jgi:valyl-tRNA synthetase
MNAKELPKIYNPQEVEDRIYSAWEKSGFFDPDVCIEKGITSENSPHFSIVLPPPNVTGILHIGHSATIALEDLMVRFHRMKGERTLWVPGTDHAAIATQEKVERIIYKETGKTRHDLGRDEFLKKVEKFASDSHDTIVKQIKKLGSSIDWNREAFTLDEKRSLAVRTAFKKMYDAGIIYRGNRIVNWDPKLKTTVSDDELERKTEKTTFYYLQYGPFTIATARPETKFGDKYVVMHPKDERYKNYQEGQKIDLEWINGPITATVIKDEAIDMDFGTGAMTITPWHDSADFEIAERHGLEKEQIVDLDGKLLPIAGEFAGFSIEEARPKIIEKLEKKGLVPKKEEGYEHEIAINSRGGGIIEPQILEQWFVAVNKEFEQKGKTVTLKSLMQEAVKSGAIEIVPKHFEKTYFYWIDNLRDWCISRQIWYGHRIPVWYKGKEIFVGIEAPKEKGWQQDPDTLDTWFSSGLWTFSTLGWPEQTEDLKNYHPTSVLETGYDILFFWVARMILMSGFLLDGEVPFRKVYLHGLVRDEKGKKMSKSLGNAIDPLEVSEKFGTDAVRLSLIIGNTPGNDFRLNEEKIASFRNFTNKIWNISRYIITSIEKTNEKEIDLDNLTLSDFWILGEFSNLIGEVSNDIDNLRFSPAGEKLRDFTWNKFADWYLEISKFEKTPEKEKILSLILKDLLKLWHPLMPFVTEYIWSDVLEEKNLLMISKWPDNENYKKLEASIEASEKFEIIQNIILAVREIRTNAKIKPSAKLSLFLEIEKDDNLIGIIKNHEGLIKKLRTGIEHLEIVEPGKSLEKSARRVFPCVTVNIPLEGMFDIEKERDRVEKEIEDIKRYLARIDADLNNKGYLDNAPQDAILKRKNTKRHNEAKLIKLQEDLKKMN